MKGHLTERSPGKWAIVLDVPSADGKRRRKWFSFTGTKRQAETEKARLIAELHGGSFIEPSRTTVAAFFERWIVHIAASVSPKTLERYAEICRKTLSPQIGAVTLSKLKTEQIDAGLSNALQRGRADGTGGLSPRTVHHARRVLIKCLNQAVTWELLAKNPALSSTPPKVEKRAMLAYGAVETAALLHAMRPTRLYAPVLLAVTCGLRRGEIIALRWKNVDLDAGQLAVVASAEQTKGLVRIKETKSGHTRTVALSHGTIAELRAHRARQAEELLQLGIRLTDDHLVVAQFDGRLLQPRSLTHEWMRQIQKLDLPRIRFHDLRHSHATQMLANGVHPKIASERLGHSNIAITLDLYSHVMPGMQSDAANAVDAALQKAVEARTKDVR